MKKILAIGSIGVVVLLVLAVFPSIVSAQTIKSNEIRTNSIKHLRDIVRKNNSNQDCIFTIGYFIFLFFLLLSASRRGMLF